MKRQIVDTSDIEILIDTFYAKVLRHPELSYFFSESVGNWAVHKQHFIRYWSAQILFTDSYQGTPLHRHIEVDQHFERSFTRAHFEEWVRLWEESVNELFIGEKAELAIESGKNMAKNIYFKMFFNRKPENLTF